MTIPDAHFGQDAAPLSRLSDGEFLQAIRFNRTAPPPMAEAAAAGDVAGFTRRLAQRRCVVRDGSGKRIAKISEQRPSVWSAAAFGDSQRTVELVQLWETFGRRRQSANGRPDAVASNGSAKSPTARWSACENRLAHWLEAAAAAPIHGFELLLLLEMLPAVGRGLSPALRWALWRTALTAAIRMCGVPTDEDDDGSAPDRILIDRGELPFRAGLLFAGVKAAAKLRRAGADFLSRALDDATDDDGMPRADLVARLPLWLAPFVRTRQWAAAFDEPLFDTETRQRLERCIRAIAPLCRADGRLALGNGESVSAVPILREAAVAAGLRRKSPSGRLLAELARGNGTAGRGKKASRARHKTSRKAAGMASRRSRPGRQSDVSRLACLRTDWSPQAAVLAVAHDDVAPRVDLSVAGASILNGAWPAEVSVDGKPVPISGGWDCTCWFSDRDVDFMELQHKRVDQGAVIDRQVLLSRGGEFAVFVDCIIGESGTPLMLRSQLPVATGMNVSSDADTRELRCKRPGTTVRCYPLSLPCDRVHGAAGRFDDAGGGLRLSQTTVGGLIAPVVLDWSAARRKQEAEWRQLTVAADGRRVSSENAGGYRLRVGDLHLVVYRSLRRTDEPRTVLGMHTGHETVIGRFMPDGAINPLLLVE
jgi:hypothetical protein